MNDYKPLEALGIPEGQIRRYESAKEGDSAYFFVEVRPTQRTCPHCGCVGAKIKEYKNKTIKGPRSQGLKTVVELRLPRYVCPSCGKTYTHSLDAAEKGLAKCQIESIVEDFYEPLTFTEIAKRHDVSVNTAVRAFDEKAPNLRVPLGKALCIDEYSNTRGSFEKYSCILVDFETRKIIDILRSRTTPYLDEYFSKQPKGPMESVEFVITDMYDGYISMARKYMRNAKIAIDPFHWMEYLTEAVQDVRRVLGEAGDLPLDSSWMGRHWRLLTCAPESVPQKTMALKSGMTITYKERVERFARQDERLWRAYLTLQDFYRVSRKWDKARKRYEWAGEEKAKSFIPFFISQMESSGIKELMDCGKTWRHYEEYIINSFIEYDGRRLSNGPVEGINSRVKTLKKLYCGYRNKSRFSERVIMIVNGRDRKPRK